jgi:hypothetical protein
VSHSLNFRPPGHVGEVGGSGSASFDMRAASVGCQFVQPMSPRSGGEAGSSRRRGRGRVRGQAFEGDLCEVHFRHLKFVGSSVRSAVCSYAYVR